MRQSFYRLGERSPKDGIIIVKVSFRIIYFVLKFPQFDLLSKIWV
jgi:hypothetical protein